MSESEWKGDHPFHLMVRHKQYDGKMVATIIDLDEGGWVDKHAALTKLPGRWYLVNKATRIMPIAMSIEEGDVAAYKARHVGVGSMTPDKIIQNEVVAYGLIRKHPDGIEESIWHFVQGLTVMGDDVNAIGMELLKVVNAVGLTQRQQQGQQVESSSTVDAEIRPSTTTH